MSTMTEHARIEKRIELAAPMGRVWRALTDSRQFGEWFRCRLEGPFVAGRTVIGQMTHPGYEHVRLEFMVQDVRPETYFSYKWHPYAVDPAIDYSAETPTLVEFRLEAMSGGTVLTVTESGFEAVPSARRAEAFRRNEGGWAGQLRNITAYLQTAAGDAGNADATS